MCTHCFHSDGHSSFLHILFHIISPRPYSPIVFCTSLFICNFHLFRFSRFITFISSTFGTILSAVSLTASQIFFHNLSGSTEFSSMFLPILHFYRILLANMSYFSVIFGSFDPLDFDDFDVDIYLIRRQWSVPQFNPGIVVTLFVELHHIVLHWM